MTHLEVAIYEVCCITLITQSSHLHPILRAANLTVVHNICATYIVRTQLVHRVVDTVRVNACFYTHVPF